MTVDPNTTKVKLVLVIALGASLFTIGMWVQSINDSVKPIPKIVENQMIIMTSLGITPNHVAGE